MMFTSLIAFILPIVLTIRANKTSDTDGSVDVYFGLLKGQKEEIISLRILLFCAVLAVLVAILGNFI